MHKSIIIASFLALSLHVDAQVMTASTDSLVKTSDALFVQRSRPIPFVVNKIQISPKDRRWITDSLIPQLRALGKDGIILGRATASPEGATENNVLLAYHRKEAMDELLSQYGIPTERIVYDVVAEDYQLLLLFMKMENDEKHEVVEKLMKRYAGKEKQLKAALQQYDHGWLWRHILHRYFPRLRAVRIMAIDRKKTEIGQQAAISLSDIHLSAPLIPLNLNIGPEVHADVPSIDHAEATQAGAQSRRELLSVKTNLLFDLAYMPGYDRFCPIPNVAIEYYPLHGHFTYGASFDGPWWQNYEDHKYFQLRNYQLHTRYYLRSGDIEKHQPGEGAAFKGWYINMYAQANLYNICFDEHRGWEGEGWGAGLGIGYVMPLGKKEHWRLEFALQAGYYWTKYDPYQWRCPVDGDADRQLYYYKWYGDAKDFKKRQHRYTWLGPTRLEVTLSYDLLYRHSYKKRR